MYKFEIKHGTQTNEVVCDSEEDFVQLICAITALSELKENFKLRIIEKRKKR